MNRRGFIGVAIAAGVSLFTPSSVSAKITSLHKLAMTSPNQQLRTVARLDFIRTPMYIMGPTRYLANRRMTIIPFRDLKKGDEFVLEEAEGAGTGNTFVTADNGSYIFKAISDPFLKDFGNGKVWTIDADPLSIKARKNIRVGDIYVKA